MSQEQNSNNPTPGANSMSSLSLPPLTEEPQETKPTKKRSPTLMIAHPDQLLKKEGGGEPPASGGNIINAPPTAPSGTPIRTPTTLERASHIKQQAMCISVNGTNSTPRGDSLNRQDEPPASTNGSKKDGVPKFGDEQTPGQAPTPSPEASKSVKMVMLLLVVLKILTSYDGGAFSVVLGADDGLAENLDLSTSESGTLSSAVFLGNLVGCIVAGNMFSQHPAKTVFVAGMAAHAGLTMLFGMCYTFESALAIRFLIGTTLALPVVYSPIWVERFAPSDRITTWMALINAGVPVGIMLGFVIGGLVPAHTDLNWRWIFYTKALAMAPLLLMMHSMDAEAFDVDAQQQQQKQQQDDSTSAALERQMDGITVTPPPTAAAIGQTKPGSSPTASEDEKQQVQAMTLTSLVPLFRKLCRNPLYVCNVLALCALYFVITALQTFVTPYLRDEPFNASMSTIVIGFGGTVVTAPVFGVIGGGVLIDRLGGYHAETALAMRIQAVWCTSCFVLSLITMLCTNVWTFLGTMWLLLAVGGAIVPVATGVLIASVEEEDRPAASSISAMAFNLLGYFSGPMFCGIVADMTDSLSWGIRVTLLCSGVGVIPSTYAAIVAQTTKLPGTSHHDAEGATGEGATEGESSPDFKIQINNTSMARTPHLAATPGRGFSQPSHQPSTPAMGGIDGVISFGTAVTPTMKARHTVEF